MNPYKDIDVAITVGDHLILIHSDSTPLPHLINSFKGKAIGLEVSQSIVANYYYRNKWHTSSEPILSALEKLAANWSITLPTYIHKLVSLATHP